jgi:pimeloyl-ACP methyl ester carboxylesterase
MVRIPARDVTLNAVQAGQGPDVVLVHGLGASLAFWYPHIAPALARAFRTTAYDLRGHGRSEMPTTGYSIASMAEDLGAILDGFAIASAHLLGHSFGAVIAIHLALSRPDRVRSLILADPVSWWAKRHAEMGSGFRRIGNDASGYPLRVRPADVVTEMSEFMAADAVSARFPVGSGALSGAPQAWRLERYPALTGSLRGAVARNRWRRLLAATTLASDLSRETGPRLGILRLVAVPCLLTYGDQSRYQPFCRILHGALPSSRLLAVHGAGHFHPVQRPEFFTAAVRDFLLPADS